MTFDNLELAFIETLLTIGELRAFGIKVEVRPANSRTNPETLKKYGKANDRLPPDKWYHVTFYPEAKAESERVHAKHTELINRGIAFDSGGGMGQRDWEIDWSFRIDQASADEHLERVNEVEKLFEDMGGL